MQSSLLRLTSAATNIDPPLCLLLQGVHAVLHQLRQWLIGVLPQMDVPNLQKQLIDIQLDGAVVDAFSHDLWAKVVGAMQSHEDSVVYLLVDICQSLVIELRALGAVVSVNIADAGCQEINLGIDEIFNLFRAREKSYPS